MKDSNRKTQDGIIVAFIAIFCSYYWATIVWPFIQQRFDLQKEKSATMAKLKKRQQMKVEEESIEKNSADDVTADDVISSSQTKQLRRRFDFTRPVRRNTDSHEKAEDNKSVRGMSCETGTEAENEEGNSLAGSTAGDFPIAEDNYDDIYDNDDYDDIENPETKVNSSGLKSPSSTSASTLSSSSLREIRSKLSASASASLKAGDSCSITRTGTGDISHNSEKKRDSTLSIETDTEKKKAKRDSLTSLWGHISRTATTIDNNSPSNPWNQTQSPLSVRTSSQVHVENIGNIGNTRNVSMTYAEARALRVLQDVEYSASIAAERDRERSERDRERSARERGDRELLLLSRINAKKSAFENFPSEPQGNLEGSVTISFRFQIISKETTPESSNDENDQNQLKDELDEKDGNNPPSDPMIQRTVNRRFCTSDYFTLLFDFIECHEFCPIDMKSIEISLFHPKQCYQRVQNDERKLCDIGIDSDIVIWVKIIK